MRASECKPLELSRRELLVRGALLPGAGAVLEAAAAALALPREALAQTGGAIGTGSSFFVGGRPRFLAAGSMDYFRHPHTEWRDRMLKAKRAGLNTIMTYVAWNQHEPEPGRYVFEGRSDLARFLRTCGELGMLAFVRVGPFICDEFEMGGHPAWLLAQPGLDLRAHSPATEQIVARWLGRLAAEIAPLQTTRGGPVAFVQVENEFYYRERPGGAAYLEFLRETMRKGGIEVPLTACGNGGELQVPSLFATVNGYGSETPGVFRKRQPDAPLLISEHYTDWMDVWTWAQTDYPKRPQLEQISLDALSQRAMLSYFCFAGGTNFGFNGSSTWKSDHSWVCTRYWAQGPVAEGGALTPNYFAAKSASLPVQQFESFFAGSRDSAMPVQLVGPVLGRALSAEAGTLVFVLPRHPVVADQRFTEDEEHPQALIEDRPASEVETEAGTLILPGGERLALAAGSVRASMLPFAFSPVAGCVIDYSNSTLLGRGGSAERPVLLFWGEAGRAGQVAINGVRHRFVYRAGEPVRVEAGAVTLLALSAELADRTWFAEGRVLVGPAYVGEPRGKQHICLVDEGVTRVLVVEADGRMVASDVEPAAAADEEVESAPLQWTRKTFEELGSAAAGWRAIGRPRPVEELGAYQGYCWYRARVPASSEAGTGILFTGMADRAHVWVNRTYQGVAGTGHGAVRDLVPVKVPAEGASVTLLLDNMGRSSEGSTMQRKGVFGPAYAGAAALEVPALGLTSVKPPEGASWQFRKFQLDAGPQARTFAAEWTLPARAGHGILLTLRDCPQYAWVSVDGAPVGEHRGDNSLIDGFGASRWTLPGGTGPQRLRIVFHGKVPDVERSVHMYTFPVAGELQDWQFRPWAMPTGTQQAAKAGEPCGWETSFARPALQAPLFFGTEGLSKGQAYLNGEAIGRYWAVGPQFSLYLPPDTMRDQNTLLLLDEAGNDPGQTTIFRDRNVPERTILR